MSNATQPDAVLTCERLLEDTLAVPDRVEPLIGPVWEQVASQVTPEAVRGIDLIVLSGSGDLYHAALGCERAFTKITGIRTLAIPSMRQGLYTADTLNSRSLVIQMSFSGKTARAVEAAGLARGSGARIWALTTDAGSSLGKLAERCLVKPDTGGNEAAGFPITMLMLYMTALEIGRVTGKFSTSGARALIETLRRVPEDMRKTIKQSAPTARELAKRFVGVDHVLFLGSGPAFGTATNGSARVLEAVGINASAQDIEEWVHLDRWVGERSSPVVVIVPVGPARDRAREVLDAMRVLGKPSIAVVSNEDNDLSRRASASLPVCCSLPEMFSPLVFNLPGELFAHSLGLVAGGIPYRDDDSRYRELGEIRWGGFIRETPPEVDPGLA